MKALTELPYRLYRVLDTETNEYWATHNGKSVWMQASHAKSAWTTTHYRLSTKFNDQKRYIIMEFITKQWEMREIA